MLWEHGAAYDLNTLIGRFPVHLADLWSKHNHYTAWPRKTGDQLKHPCPR
jgi:hypothetical protein